MHFGATLDPISASAGESLRHAEQFPNFSHAAPTSEVIDFSLALNSGNLF